MSVRDVKIGDKLRLVSAGEYTSLEVFIGEEFIIDGETEEGILYTTGFGCFPNWNIYKEDLHMYEKIEEEKEESSDSLESTLDLIANLAQEVAKLKRELSDLRSAMHAQAYEDHERIERILDDIVMLDERTQDVNNGGQKLLSKEVYIYDTE